MTTTIKRFLALCASIVVALGLTLGFTSTAHAGGGYSIGSPVVTCGSTVKVTFHVTGGPIALEWVIDGTPKQVGEYTDEDVVLDIGAATNGSHTYSVLEGDTTVKSGTFKVDCKPAQPADKVVYSAWVDGAKDCKSGTVAQTRTKTVTPSVWNGTAWVDGTPVVTTETQTRTMTAAEKEQCAVIPPQPDSKVVFGSWKDGAPDCKSGTVTQTRTKTVTPSVWNGTAWVDGTPVVTTETQTRTMTAAEKEQCAVIPPQPDSKVVFGSWKDGAPDCKSGTVTQTRTKTVTPSVWNGTAWVDGTPVVTTETQTRTMTAAEKSACPSTNPPAATAPAVVGDPYAKKPNTGADDIAILGGLAALLFTVGTGALVVSRRRA